jgi:hypothetical protein
MSHAESLTILQLKYSFNPHEIIYRTISISFSIQTNEGLDKEFD